jgi:DNA-binding transcriptional ArsR family regulator
MSSTKRDAELVDRDQQVLSRLARIEHKVDSLDQTTAFALRADSAKHQESIREIFGTSARRAQVYVAADGHKTVQQIASHLKMKAPNVSKELGILKTEGLLELTSTSAAGDVYSKKAVEKTLRISKFLNDTLLSSGSAKGKKKRRA